MSTPEHRLEFRVDVTNPGQFFACCGLLELADRHFQGAQAHFDGDRFLIDTPLDASALVPRSAAAELVQVDPSNTCSSAIDMRLPGGSIRLDWWQDSRAGGGELKVWAGTMESVRIARAMQHILRNSRFHEPDLFNVGRVVPDPDEPSKKVEPFYFDARRCSNSHSRDVGFSTNDLQMTTTAFPAVEFFCLVGLQRCLPKKTDEPRVFDYHTWSIPLCPSLAPAAVCGLLPFVGGRGYRFENWYRTGQRKHKSFRSANPILSRGEL